MSRLVAPALVCRGIRKSFGGTAALDGAELEVSAGEVSALIGENGAGKSTLTKIVSGAIAADAGTLELDGQRYAPKSPQEARAAGVAIVYQEPLVAGHLSVEENVLLGAEPSRFGFVQKKELRARAERALELVRSEASELRPEMEASRLTPAEAQLVCIARALAVRECRLLILDEPTASLAAHDVARLFEVVRRLRDRGYAILYISHFLEEIAELCDRYTVLRDGRTVGSGRISETTTDGLVELMTGRRVARSFEKSPRSPGEVVISGRELSGRKLPVSASFELRKGEVLGLAGLVGSGRTELLRAVFGLDRLRGGTLTIGAFVGPASPVRRLAQGVGLLSEDRKREGLAEDLTLTDNVVLSKLAGMGPFGLVLPGRARAVTEKWIKRLGIRARDPDQRARELSGGNQQKLALARLLHHDVDVLLLDEPTRGIDVASRFEVFRLVDELGARGKAVLVVSSQFPELLAVCDRIAVMHRGVLGPARPAAELDEARLIKEAASG